MHVFVAGAKGQLGSELVDVARAAGHDVTATDVEECNLLDPDSVEFNLDAAGPDVAVNCAAWTKVDLAETEQAGARSLNVDAARNLAAACDQRGIAFTHISTDYVFDGTAREPIPENAATNPTSAYGATKLEGEIAVADACANSRIVRTAWLYGRNGPNFVLTMLRLAREGKPIRVVDDQFGSPTWTGHLAPAVLELTLGDQTGIFHVTNSGAASWFDFAKAIVTTSGYDVPVSPIHTSEYPTPAPRPAYSVLDNRRWLELGHEPLPDWKDGMRGYLSELKAGQPA
jgi:dTDP-4-dehydrorhamnose reductase